MKNSKDRFINMLCGIMFFISVAFYIGFAISLSYLLKDGILFNTLMVISTIMFIINCFICIRLDIEFGHFECSYCHKKVIPSYKELMLKSYHIFNKYWLTCPNCNGKRWVVKKFKDD